MEEKKTNELTDDSPDTVSGGIKRNERLMRTDYCSTSGKKAEPDGEGRCPNCGKWL